MERVPLSNLLEVTILVDIVLEAVVLETTEKVR
jgi:hypothetical protein